MECASRYATLLQTYEKASGTIEKLRQGEEPKEFWGLWGLSGEPTIKYRANSDWDIWLADVELAEKSKSNIKPMVYAMKKCKLVSSPEDEELVQLREMKPRLYM